MSIIVSENIPPAFDQTGDGPAWFCLRTQNRQERLAAAHLRSMEGVEVLYPRMQFKRKWRLTTREFTEPLFPNYVFARFNPRVALARVRHAYGVQTVVHFGSRPVIVPEATIEEIRKNLGAEQVCQVKTVLAPGDAVTICHGAFSGLHAVIKHYLPRKQRVQLLLEFLGHQTNIEVDEGEVVKEYPHPMKKLC